MDDGCLVLETFAGRKRRSIIVSPFPHLQRQNTCIAAEKEMRSKMDYRAPHGVVAIINMDLLHDCKNAKDVWVQDHGRVKVTRKHQ